MKFYVKAKTEMYFLIVIVTVLSLLICMTPVIRYRDLNDNYYEYINQERMRKLTITDRNAQPIFHESKFSDDRDVRVSTFHIVGDKNNGVPGSLLNDEDITTSIFNGYQSKEETVKLTIDLKLQTAALSLLEENNQNGTIIISDYITGEILCMTSTPSVDVLDATEIKDESYLNKAIYTYIPGSVFKPVSVGCMVEKDKDIIEAFSYTCRGADGKITCTQAHGKVTLEEALYKSCNCAISKASEYLDSEDLDEFIDEIGIMDSDIVSGIDIKEGNFNSKDNLRWSVNGQGDDLISPLGLMSYYSAIANEGAYRKMYFRKEDKTSKKKTYFSKETAKYLQDTLSKGMEEWYGSPINCKSFGKTGTAETGEGNSHAWFICCLTDENYPEKTYTIAVMLKDGGSSKNAMNIAAQFINQNILKNNDS